MATPTKEEKEKELEIIRRAQSSEDAAFGELYDKYRPKLFKHVLFKYVSMRRDGQDDADDVVSVTFSQAQKSLVKYDPARGTFYSWLKGIAKRVWIDIIIKPAEREVTLAASAGGGGSGDHGGEDLSDTYSDPFTEKMDWLEFTYSKEEAGEWDWFESWDGIEEALDYLEQGGKPISRLSKDISKLSSFQRDILRHLADPDISIKMREINKKVAKSFLTDRMRKSIYRKLEIAIIGEKSVRINEEAEKNLGAFCPIIDSRELQKKAKEGGPYAKALLENAEPDKRGLEYKHNPPPKRRNQEDIAESMGVPLKKFEKGIYLIKKKIKK